MGKGYGQTFQCTGYTDSSKHIASTGARHPGIWSQVGLRKHNYEQS